MLGRTQRGRGDREDARLNRRRRRRIAHLRGTRARPDPRRRLPARSGDHCPPIARRAHHAVPVGRSFIARRGWPPSCGLRGPRGRGSACLGRPSGHPVGDGAARPRTVPRRARRGRIRRELHRAERHERRLWQVPDHAVELGGLGEALSRQLHGPADAGEPGDRGPSQGDGPLHLARRLADGRPLVADRILGTEREPLVLVLADLRQPGHDAHGHVMAPSGTTATTTSWISSADHRLGDASPATSEVAFMIVITRFT